MEMIDILPVIGLILLFGIAVYQAWKTITD